MSVINFLFGVLGATGFWALWIFISLFMGIGLIKYFEADDDRMDSFRIITVLTTGKDNNGEDSENFGFCVFMFLVICVLWWLILIIMLAYHLARFVFWLIGKALRTLVTSMDKVVPTVRKTGKEITVEMPNKQTPMGPPPTEE